MEVIQDQEREVDSQKSVLEREKAIINRERTNRQKSKGVKKQMPELSEEEFLRVGVYFATLSMLGRKKRSLN